MGGTQSKDPFTTFTASVAPTGRAKCRTCGQAIPKGSVRVSRQVPSNFRGEAGTATHNYHMDHGMQAAARVRCREIPPAFELDASLSVAQRDVAGTAAAEALATWQARCDAVAMRA